MLTEHHAVKDCGIVGVPGDLGEEDIKAYVHLEEGEDLSPEEIVEWCEERLAYFKVPRFIEYVTEFPRTITKQEIERHALRELGRGDSWDRLAKIE